MSEFKDPLHQNSTYSFFIPLLQHINEPAKVNRLLLES